MTWGLGLGAWCAAGLLWSALGGLDIIRAGRSSADPRQRGLVYWLAQIICLPVILLRAFWQGVLHGGPVP